MSVPTHGYSCRKVRCYKTSCQYCSSKVYYYECTCGSKVFFDSLGDWQLHACPKLEQQTRERLRQESSFIIEKLSGKKSQSNLSNSDAQKKSSSISSNSAPKSKIELSIARTHRNGTIAKNPLSICKHCGIEVRTDRMSKHLHKCKKNKSTSLL